MGTVGEGLQPAVYTPLRDEVLTTLRQALITGGFSAGERIREVELAARLGVSRGTLREALRHLEQEGLVVTSPHRGTFVVNPTPEEVADIFGLRIALEAYAAEEAARLITPDELKTLQRVVDDIAAMGGVMTLAPRVELDFHFHELICEAADNARLLRVWAELCGPLRVLLAALSRPFLNADETSLQHQRVVDALRRGDGEAARAALASHLTQSKDRMIATLQAKRALAQAGALPDSRP
ncbi:MAG TPA: GntR family transcriptional regulator [Thermomicrobiales bacterium]|nr:GntR family transcriptional regulator [Thermomicrobiales bacterium]